MKLIMMLAIGTLLFSCGNLKSKPASAVENNTVENNDTTIGKASLGDIMQDSDPITIEKASISGNRLTLDISYSGGCQDHSFDLVGSFALMKSLPAKRSVKLIHKANGDSCREFISKTLVFDISNLASAPKSGVETILLLDGHKDQLSYTFE